MDRTNLIPVENETRSIATRSTIEGRTLTYEMTVLQQPVRARACGKGAKSSADRRPVDPPPIVELRIFDGENKETDVTFTMNASYFLFASLEQARPIAHGRVTQDRNTHPVLTGTPVAGMVYLDRPQPAGYFIFPDLSVRHEGKYRLSFSLYEELKHTKDQDKVAEEAMTNAAGDAHVTHRLEVKSEPFHVYSAKKFPGLTESTSLSRVVAEQGCRVRIRRDVRMRRRENDKSGGKDWDEYEDQTAQDRARMSATPDQSVYGSMNTPHGFVESAVPRPRSASNASHRSLSESVSRRPSMQELGHTYQQSQQTPQTAYSQSSLYGPSPVQVYPQTYAQQASMHQPAQYAQGYPAPPGLPSQAPAPQQGYYGYASARPAPIQPSQPKRAAPPPPPPPSYESELHQQQTDPRLGSAPESDSSDPRHSGYVQHAAPSSYLPIGNGQQMHQQSAPSQSQQHSDHHYSSSVDMYQQRPVPLEPMRPPTHATGGTTPLPSRSPFDLPPLQTTMLPNHKLEASSPSSGAPPSSYFTSAHTSSSDNHKRSYGNVFSDRHQSQPLRQGARPSIPHDAKFSAGLSISAVDDDDTSADLDLHTLSMHYRRADGRQILRALPGA